MKRHRPTSGLLVAGIVTLALLSPRVLLAADHAEAPGTQTDPAADIADLYAWHDAAENRLVAVITFAGLAPRGGDATIDPGVVYSFSIDNDGDAVEDQRVDARFLQDTDGEWLLQVDNLPGWPDPIVGAVNSQIRRGQDYAVYAGLRDDPFFFDLEGFLTTLATGTLSFDGTRDSVAGLNATAIVLQMDLAAALDGGSSLNVWATTARQ